MDPVKAVMEFFSNLFRQRVNRVESQAKQKINSAQVKAKTAASKKVNAALDGGIQKAKDKVTGAKPEEGEADQAG